MNADVTVYRSPTDRPPAPSANACEAGSERRTASSVHPGDSETTAYLQIRRLRTLLLKPAAARALPSSARLDRAGPCCLCRTVGPDAADQNARRRLSDRVPPARGLRYLT